VKNLLVMTAFRRQIGLFCVLSFLALC